MITKKFTLIELVVTITVLGIILAIILVNINQSKKAAIHAAVASNISILQNSLDEYHLRGIGKIPTVSNEVPTLTEPKFIDVKYLAEKGYIKQNLDLSKIKDQYYWVDSFGKVWGATETTIKPISKLHSNAEGELSFVLSKEYYGYKIYKVKRGSDSRVLTYEGLTASTNKQFAGSVYQEWIVSEETLEDDLLVTVPLSEEDLDYTILVSAIDQYGLETVPIGETNNGFKPLIKKEGVFYYNIESKREMYFLKFWDLIDTPGNSSVSYRFATMDRYKGDYGDYVDTFKEVLEILEKGYGIEVEITMKGDEEGNLPSVLQLHILFTYNKDKVNDPKDYCFFFPEDCEPNDELCLIFPEDCIGSSNCQINCGSGPGGDGGSDGGGSGGDGGPSGGDGGSSGGGDGGPGGIGGTGGNSGGTGGPGGPGGPGGTGGTGGGGSVCLTNPAICVPTCEVSNTCIKPTEICPNNYTKSHVSGDLKYVSNLMKLKDNEKITSIPKPTVQNGLILVGVKVEFSKDGSAFKEIKSIKELPAGSCLNIVYIYKNALNFPPPPPPETCEIGVDCPLTCEDLKNCPEEYVTIKEFSLYAHSPVGEMNTWEGYRTEEDLKEGTRIIYSFSLGNLQSGFHNYSDVFPTNQRSESITAKVQLQVRKDLVDTGVEPRLIRFIFDGDITDEDYDLLNQRDIVKISYTKDNNNGRNTISDESIVNWHYTLSNSTAKVVKVNWSKPNENQKYSVGNHSINVLLTFEDGRTVLGSPYNFKVVSEKPTAVIEATVGGEELRPYKVLKSEDKIVWTNPLETSKDPDLDEIVDYEFRGNVEQSTSKFTVSLRVKDSEGHWSDWTEKTYNDPFAYVDKTKYSKVIYVASNGSDSNVGTESSPKKTIKGAYQATLAQGQNAILVKAGSYELNGVNTTFKMLNNVDFYGEGENTVITNNSFSGNSFVVVYQNTSFNKMTLNFKNAFAVTYGFGNEPTSNYKLDFNNVHLKGLSPSGSSAFFITNGYWGNNGSNTRVSISINNSVVNGYNRHQYSKGNSPKMVFKNSIVIVSQDQFNKDYREYATFQTSLEDIAIDQTTLLPTTAVYKNKGTGLDAYGKTNDIGITGGLYPW